MSKTTTNYGLIKPELTDVADITAMNKNWDTIDQEMKGLSEVVPIGRGGTGATTVDEALKNLGIPEYQKPWNVDENIGGISPSTSFELRCKADSTEPTVASLPLLMINSGTIYLDYSYSNGSGTNNGTSYAVNNASISVYVNDEIIHTNSQIGTYSSSQLDYDGIPMSGEVRVGLSVNKGDNVTIVAQGVPITSGKAANMTMGVILKANVETPYTYLTLGDDLENSTAKILDVLLGV